MKDKNKGRGKLLGELEKLRQKIEILGKIKKVNEKLQMLQESILAVHSSLDLERVFKKITDATIYSLRYTTCILLTLNDGGKNFRVRTFSTKRSLLPRISEILGSPLKSLLVPNDPDLNPGIRSVIEGRLVILKKLAEIAYPLISKNKCLALQNLGRAKNYIVAPLKVEEKVIGAMFITSSQEEVTEEEKKMIQTFTRAASQAITNAKLHLQIEKMRKALFHEKELLDVLMDNIPDSIYFKDVKSRFIRINRAQVKALGITDPHQAVGKTDFNFFSEEHAEKAYRDEQEIIKTGKPLIGKIEKDIRPNGWSRWVSTTKVPILDEKGKVIGIVGISRDITQYEKTKEELKHALNQLRESLGKIVQVVTLMVERKDPYTAGHQRRVADLARAIAKEMSLSSEQIEAIRIAGTIHDIGKINIPTEILGKPGRISESEFSIIKSHPKVGYEIIKRIEFPWPVADIVLQHHERMDGSGYPQGLKDDEILLESRILAVADVVEAMSSHRPYRPALGIDIALEEVVKNRGKLYDTEVVDTCLKLFKERGFKFD